VKFQMNALDNTVGTQPIQTDWEMSTESYLN
jgi:hypothetical protein